MWNIKRNRQSLEHGRKLVGNSLQQLSPVSTNVSADSIGAHSSTSWEVGQRTSALPSPEVSLTQRDLAAWRYQLNGTTIHRQIPLARFVEYWHTRQRDNQTPPMGENFIFYFTRSGFNRTGLSQDRAMQNLNFLGHSVLNDVGLSGSCEWSFVIENIF